MLIVYKSINTSLPIVVEDESRNYNPAHRRSRNFCMSHLRVDADTTEAADYQEN